MKAHSIFTILAAFGVTTLATASTLREHRVADLHKSSVAKVESFARDLSFALNEMRNCDPKTKKQLDFGMQITDVTYSDSRNGVRSSTITAKGAYPMPSGREYTVTLSVSSKPVKEKIFAPDKPARRIYSCDVQKTN